MYRYQLLEQVLEIIIIIIITTIVLLTNSVKSGVNEPRYSGCIHRPAECYLIYGVL